MSCMPAAKTVPSVTHKNAGNQPQITTTAGPIMGAAPATEVKWCAHRTYLLVGTKSTPSSMVWAGVLELEESLKTFLPRNFEYNRYPATIMATPIIAKSNEFISVLRVGKYDQIDHR